MSRALADDVDTNEEAEHRLELVRPGDHLTPAGKAIGLQTIAELRTSPLVSLLRGAARQQFLVALDAAERQLNAHP